MFNLAPVPVPDLNGRTILVTGAGRGIGAELVRLLVDRGARVYAGVFGEAEALPPAATVLSLDVTKQAAVDAVVARSAREAGRLDVLVNNAGTITPIGHLATLPSDALAPAFAVNVIGVHRMVVAALPLLRASRGMMALELGPEGIQTVFIGIPPTDTAMQAEIRAAGLNPISKIPQEKLVPTTVPASVMAYLCSAAARSIDETMLDVRQDRFTAMMAL